MEVDFVCQCKNRDCMRIVRVTTEQRSRIREAKEIVICDGCEAPEGYKLFEIGGPGYNLYRKERIRS